MVAKVKRGMGHTVLRGVQFESQTNQLSSSGHAHDRKEELAGKPVLKKSEGVRYAMWMWQST